VKLENITLAQIKLGFKWSL